MTMFASIDAEGRALGFHDTDLEAAPGGTIELTLEQWSTWSADQARHRWQDGQLVQIEPPAPQPELPAPLSAREFRERFTRAERGAITLAASQRLEQGDPTLQVFLDDLTATGAVYLDHPDLLEGVQLLVSLALIDQQRADQLLAPVSAS